MKGRPASPADEPAPAPERAIELTVAGEPGSLPEPGSPAGSRPSFRGPAASGVADDQGLPDEWSDTGHDVL